MWQTFVVFLGEWGVELGGAAALAVLVEAFFKPIRKFFGLFSRSEKLELSEDTIDKISTNQAKNGASLSVPEFIRIRRELKADLEKELASAPDAEKDQLRARITELETQIADPEPALKIANERIADLEARLAREGNDLGAEKLDAARAAMETGDYSVADDLFAEIEARNALAVQSAARAAFARGEIAEAEVRWADAAKHYARAAGHDPTLDNLFKVSEFARRTGDYGAALGYGESTLKLTRNGDDQIALSKALNDHALLLKNIGRNDEAEPLYRESMQITRATLGKDHPEYSTRLNNLAVLLKDTGRFEEAEPLYREAIQITGVTLGKGHPDYGTRLSNLAVLLQVTGRFEEAESLYREAMQITEATLGKDHPAYATRLNNLAILYANMNRFDEALSLMEQALMILETALGADHPNTERSRQSLVAMRADAEK